MIIKGLQVSEGIGVGKVYIINELDLNIKKISISDNTEELKKFDKAIIDTIEKIEEIKEHTKKVLGEEKALVFESHIMLLQDPELINQVKNKIVYDNCNAEFALKEVRDSFVMIFSSMEDNEYMQERAIDIKDTTNRVIAFLTNQKYPDLMNINEEVIIITNDLTPSDTAQLNKKYVKGIATNIGGKTSHSAIMARTLQIPCIVGTNNITKLVKENQKIILDAINGEIHLETNDELLSKFINKQSKFEEFQKNVLEYINKETTTKDNFKTELAANIGSVKDLEKVLKSGAEGIGLFRTEFLYMDSTSLPTEEEQFESYKTVLENMNNKPVVIRTLDIGGDKELSYLPLPKETNPFLGYRAIRLCLDRKDIFKTQLRALLRASTYGNLKIMFPMIATVDEFIESKNYLLNVKEELINEGISVSNVEVGMMMEIPSAAILADVFAEYVDFFSIGTNDLIQYSFAADRMNEHVSYLYQPLNPSLLRLVNFIITSAHKKGKWVGMCGEVASDKDAIPFLIGMGLDEFSMSSSAIAESRYIISKLNKKDLENLVDKALKSHTSNDVLKLLEEV